MFVTDNNSQKIIANINMAPIFALDTETTGLDSYSDCEIFAMSISTENDDYYFNFNPLEPSDILLERKIIKLLKPTGLVFMQNAKFDMGFLSKEGLEFDDWEIHCTWAGGRVNRNDMFSLAMAYQAKLIGEEKLDIVKQYMNKHKLYEYVMPPGAKKRKKNYFYNQVPLEVMMPYALRDSRVTYKLGIHQLKSINKQDESIPPGKPRLIDVMENEKKLTKVLFHMEQVGVKINPVQCQEAFKFEKLRAESAAEDFQINTGYPLVDSPKSLSLAFDAVNEKYGTTLKGNASFAKEVLDGLDSPLADILKIYRNSYKKAYTYYFNFINMRDQDDAIHCQFNQGGTATGRFSCSEPNLQNVPKRKEDKATYPVRRCFIPREGFTFYMVDYDQMEYRLMLDYAGEMGVIEQVLGGMDVHQATANMLNIKRDTAKTINFALLYGVGNEQLGKMLGLSTEKAKDLRTKYYEKLPKVSELLRNVMNIAEKRGYILNWFGRRFYFTRKTAYKAPNYLIQGSAADVIKIAMIRIHDFLNSKHLKSRMLLQVHDELIFEIADGEEYILPSLKRYMENVRPHKYLPLTVSAEKSSVSWQDKSEVVNIRPQYTI